MPDTLMWLGRLSALSEEDGDTVQSTMLRMHIQSLGGVLHDKAVATVLSTLHHLIARYEIRVPAASRSAFLAPGDTFGSFSAVGTAIKEAAGSLLVVDPFLDQIFMTDFAPWIAERVELRLLGTAKSARSALPRAVELWREKYDDVRPISLRICQNAAVHDRYLFDPERVWHVSQSFNKIATRAPALITPITGDTADLTRTAHEEIWASADPA